MSGIPTLSDDEARRVTECPDCGHLWSIHAGRTYGRCLLYAPSGDPCPCTRADETLTQVAALKAEWQAEVLKAAAVKFDGFGRVNQRDVDRLRAVGFDHRAAETRAVVYAEAARIVRGLIPEDSP